MAVARPVVHYGPPDPDRNQKIFEECLAVYQPGRSVFLYVVVAPTRRRQLERAFLERFPSVFEIPLLTFDGLIATVLKHTELAVQILDETEKQLLIEEVLAQGGFSLGRHLKRVGGLLPHISQFISSIKEKNIGNEKMLRLQYQRLEKGLSGLEEELVLIFSRYQRALEERRLEDSAGAKSLVYENLLTGRVNIHSVVPGLRRIVWEGFTHLTPLERAIVQFLNTEAETVFSIDLDSQMRELDPYSETLQDLLQFLETLKPEWNFFAGTEGKPVQALLQPETREMEVAEVAERIKLLQKTEADFRLSDIAIICSRPSHYKMYVHEIFPEWGIPFRWLPGENVLESKAVSAFLHYLQFLEHDGDREDLSGLLSQPWIESKELLQVLDLEINQNRLPAEWATLLLERFQQFFKVTLEGADEEPCRFRGENLSVEKLLRKLQSSALAQRHVSLPAFRAWVQRELSRSTVRAELDGDGVLVGEKQDFQQGRFRFLFWLGFAEGEFPDPPPQSIFFDDTRSSQWGMHNGKKKTSENYHLFHVLRHAAVEGVYFSCPKRSSEAPVLPSPFLRSLDHVSALPLLNKSSTQIRSRLRPESHGRTNNVRRGLEVQAQRESLGLSPFEGVLSSPLALARLREAFFADGVKISPTQLEAYLQCGFRFLMRNILRVEPLQEIEDELTPLQKGDFIHRILFRFFNEQPADSTVASKEEWVEKRRRLMARIVAEELPKIPFQDLFWKHQEKKLTRGLSDGGDGMLARFIDLEWDRAQQFSVHGVEVRFGPLRLGEFSNAAADEIPVYLHGTIDRVDSSAEGHFLIDYKTGRQDYQKRTYEGWGFQLPLYMLAAARLLKREVDGAGFYYLRFPLEVELKELDLHDRTTFEKVIEYYREKAVEAARHVYDGHFPVTLLGPANAGCPSCAYRHICRRDAAKMELVRKSEDFLSHETVVERGRWLTPKVLTQISPKGKDPIAEGH